MRTILAIMIMITGLIVSYDKVKDYTYERGDSVFVVCSNDSIKSLRVRDVTSNYILGSDGIEYNKIFCFTSKDSAIMYTKMNKEDSDD